MKKVVSSMKTIALLASIFFMMFFAMAICTFIANCNYELGYFYMNQKMMLFLTLLSMFFFIIIVWSEGRKVSKESERKDLSSSSFFSDMRTMMALIVLSVFFFVTAVGLSGVKQQCPYVNVTVVVNGTTTTKSVPDAICVTATSVVPSMAFALAIIVTIATIAYVFRRVQQ